MSRLAPRCPDCPEGPVGVPLVFGLPSSEDFEAAERGEFVLGGCVLDPGPTPRWACPHCERPLGWETDTEVAAPEDGLTRVATWNLRGGPTPWVRERGRGRPLAGEALSGHLAAHRSAP